MSKTINVAWGLCAPMRPQHVLPLLEPYHVRIERLEMYRESTHTGALVTVSDAAAKWTEYLLCRSGKFSLLSKPLEPRNIQWAEKWQTIPIQRGCNAHKMEGTVRGTMGQMPATWDDKAKQAKQTKQTGGVLGWLFGQPQEQPRRTARKQRRTR